MFKIDDFLAPKKALLIAPAGFGKTHSIGLAMKKLSTKGKHLILTHTHAGITSLKEKLKKEEIPSNSYNIETIAGFAQQFVLSFYTGQDIPAQSDTKYFRFILDKAIVLFQHRPIQRLLSRSYNSLFVDEYQDCTASQHQLITLLSNLFPTKVLGDPLQGIFQFDKNDLLVDMRDKDQMGDFFENQFELHEPQRWLRGNNVDLGKDLKLFRTALLNKEQIKLADFKSVELVIGSENDINKPYTDYYKQLSKIIDERNLLIIHPIITSPYPRLNLIKKFNNRFILLESIDDKMFYKLATQLNNIQKNDCSKVLRSVCDELFNKTGIDKWLKGGRLISKKGEDKTKSDYIAECVEKFEKNRAWNDLHKAIVAISKLPYIKCYRKEMFNSLCRALEYAEENNLNLEESMVEIRNIVRRYGKRATIKCIGTTLLTKGLEFETVVILDAHKFECPKNLYVAFTRASKRLVVFSTTKTLTPKY